jgi:hypothetical protein
MNDVSFDRLVRSNTSLIATVIALPSSPIAMGLGVRELSENGAGLRANVAWATRFQKEPTAAVESPSRQTTTVHTRQSTAHRRYLP